jgi:histidinol-phosphate aminotransferase
MQRVKTPYSLNRVSELVAIKALRNQDFVRKGVELVNKERKRLEKRLSGLGFKVFTSEANYILFKSPIDHSRLVRMLSEKGVMIRDFGKNRRLENCVRTTIGTREMNDALLSKLEEVLAECH